MKNKNNGLRGLIIISIFLLLIIIGLIVYKNYFYKKNEKPKETKEEEITNDKTIETLSIDSKEVQNAMKSLEKIKITEDNAYKGIFTIKDISNYELLDTAFSDMFKDGTIKSVCDTEVSEGITAEEINLKLKNVFNYNYNISVEDIIKNSEEAEPGSNIRNLGIYNIEIKNDVVYVKAPCDVNTGFKFLNKSITKAEKEDNTVYIYSKVAFGLYDFDIVEYYDDYLRNNQKEVLKITDYEDTNIVDIPPKWELYKTYKYTFKIIDSKYFIDKIEVEK